VIISFLLFNAGLAIAHTPNTGAGAFFRWPGAGPIATFPGIEGGEFHGFTIELVDGSPGECDAITLVPPNNLPAGYEVSCRPESCSVVSTRFCTAGSWIPQLGQAGTYVLKFIAQDEHGATLSGAQPVGTYIIEQATPPEFLPYFLYNGDLVENVSEFSATVGELFTLGVYVRDVDGSYRPNNSNVAGPLITFLSRPAFYFEKITDHGSILPPGANFSCDTCVSNPFCNTCVNDSDFNDPQISKERYRGMFEWTPTSSDISTHTATFIVSDNTSLVSQPKSVNIVVKPAEAPGDFILHGAEPVQAVEDVQAFVKDKATVFKVVIENTFPGDQDVEIIILVDSVRVHQETVHIKANCKATFYLPENVDPTTDCDGKTFTTKNSIKPFTTAGFSNVEVVLDPFNTIKEIEDDINNKIVFISEVEDIKPFTVLYVPIKHSAADMITPCPLAQRDANGFCSPNAGRITTAHQWMSLVYPVSTLNYVKLPTITNTHAVSGQQIPGLMADLIKMKTSWKNSHLTAGEVLMYGWLPSGTINNGWGQLGGFVGYGDESVQGNGQFGDMHINDLILAHEGGHGLNIFW